MNVFTEVKERVSCVDLAKGYGIQLKKIGTHYVCLCPFHREKTPSMVVHSDHYHCFGCGVGGDAISFVSKLQGLKPLESVLEIAQRFGLPIIINQDKPMNPKKKRYYSQEDFLNSLEAWRDEVFPVYITWFQVTEEALQGMTMDMPGFKELLEMRADLDYITEQLISDTFEDVYKVYQFIKGGVYELSDEGGETTC
jgi:hypothetical protein